MTGVWGDLKMHYLARRTFADAEHPEAAIQGAVMTLNTHKRRRPLADHRIFA